MRVQILKLSFLCLLQDSEGGGAAAERSDNSDDDDARVPVAIKSTLHFPSVLKTVGHHEIVKLYMFLLQQYSRLDAPTLHAIASFFHRLCSQLHLEPIFFKVRP